MLSQKILIIIGIIIFTNKKEKAYQSDINVFLSQPECFSVSDIIFKCADY